MLSYLENINKIRGSISKKIKREGGYISGITQHSTKIAQNSFKDAVK